MLTGGWLGGGGAGGACNSAHSCYNLQLTRSDQILLVEYVVPLSRTLARERIGVQESNNFKWRASKE